MENPHRENPPEENQHRGLKFLVIFMGVLIIIGIGVVAYTIISRLVAGVSVTDPKTVEAPVVSARQVASPQPVTDPVTKRTPRPPEPFGDVTAKIPGGAVIEETTTARGRLILRLRLPGGGQAIQILSLRTGERLGLIRLQPE